MKGVRLCLLVLLAVALAGCWNPAELVVPPIMDVLPEEGDAYLSLTVEPHRPLLVEAVALSGLPKGVVDAALSGADHLVGASKDGVFILGADLRFPQTTIELGLLLANGWKASEAGFRNEAAGLEISPSNGHRIVVSTGQAMDAVGDYLDGQVPELPTEFLDDAERYDALIYVPDAKSFLRGVDPRFAAAPVEDLTVRVAVRGSTYILETEMASVNTLGARFAEGILKVLARNVAGAEGNPLAGLAEAEIEARGSRLVIREWRIPRDDLAALIAGFLTPEEP